MANVIRLHPMNISIKRRFSCLHTPANIYYHGEQFIPPLFIYPLLYWCSQMSGFCLPGMSNPKLMSFIPLFSHISRYENAGYLLNITFIFVKVLPQLSCHDTCQTWSTFWYAVIASPGLHTNDHIFTFINIYWKISIIRTRKFNIWHCISSYADMLKPKTCSYFMRYFL